MSFRSQPFGAPLAMASRGEIGEKLTRGNGSVAGEAADDHDHAGGGRVQRPGDRCVVFREGQVRCPIIHGPILPGWILASAPVVIRTLIETAPDLRAFNATRPGAHRGLGESGPGL